MAGLLLVVVGLLLTARPVQGVITSAPSLKKLLAGVHYVCTARVEKVDPDRPAVILTVDGDLKGKMPVRQLPMNLTGDSDAAKYKHTPVMLKRLAKDLPLVLFLIKTGDRYVAFGYTNGTWFQFTGQKDGDKVRWTFTHAEPYLRRTYKGTTAEMRQLLTEVLAGKKQPPEPDEKVEPGFGPEAKPHQPKAPARGFPCSRFGLQSAGPLFAVIPTIGIGAPLAALAMLFPTVFGGLIVLFRRWVGLLTVVGTDSTLFMLYAWQRPRISGYWWGTPGALWTLITAITLLGALWAWRRHVLTLRREQPAEEIPARTEMWTLIVLSVVAAGGVTWYLIQSNGKPSLGNSGWKVLLLLSVGFWAGTLYAAAARLGSRGKPSLPTEGVMLWTMAAACAFLTTGGVEGKVSGPVDLSDKQAGTPKRGARLLRQVWKFEPGGQGDVSSSPTLAGKQVYIGLIGGNIIEKTGAIYCLNRDTGKEIWHFDNKGKMRPPHSSPCVANGRVYIGEGFHENAGCRLFCLAATNGKKLWEFETASHTESSPRVADGKVFFGAGDDGLYCLNAETGKMLWQYPPPDAREGLHIDSSPTIIGKRLYCGSGVSRSNRKLQVFCLDTDSGKPVWVRDDVDIPSWSAPAVYDGRVYFGLANGRLTISDEKPRGALLCLDARDGKRLWYFERVKDAVHTRPAVDAHHVYFGSRDSHFYCLDRRSGTLVWKKDLQSPVVASPALARCSCCDATTSLYVAAMDGSVYCLDPDSGAVFWKHGELTGYSASQLSAPVVEVQRSKDGDRRRIYLASGVNSNSQAVVYCLEDQW
jgi:outer membrane protein assembly factor BamB